MLKTLFFVTHNKRNILFVRLISFKESEDTQTQVTCSQSDFFPYTSQHPQQTCQLQQTQKRKKRQNLSKTLKHVLNPLNLNLALHHVQSLRVIQQFQLIRAEENKKSIQVSKEKEHAHKAKEKKNHVVKEIVTYQGQELLIVITTKNQFSQKLLTQHMNIKSLI